MLNINSDKIFILGASGDIGSQLTHFLLKKKAEVTLYVRDSEKTKALFPEIKELNIVQGDYTTVDVFEKAIVGHTRLFILIYANPQMASIKGTFAKIAYAAGVRQIVDISSFTVNFPYKSSYICTIHSEGEERIRQEKREDQFFVALRPAYFYTSHLWFIAKNIKENHKLDVPVTTSLDLKESYVSTTDIAELASVVLTEPMEKHANSTYTMVSDALSANDRAELFSELVGKKIDVNRLSLQEMYDHFISLGFPHVLAYDFISFDTVGKTTPAYEVVLGRPAQTFKQWLQSGNIISHFK